VNDVARGTLNEALSLTPSKNRGPRLQPCQPSGKSGPDLSGFRFRLPDVSTTETFEYQEQPYLQYRHSQLPDMRQNRADTDVGRRDLVR